MKILYIGCVDFSAHCLSHILNRGEKVVAVLSKTKSAFHADFQSLKPIAQKYKIPFYAIEDVNDPKTLKIIRTYKPDVIFCFGWSQLLKKEIFRLAPKGVIGVHPSLLPLNRGRHPLIWTLCLGLKEGGLTFFRMNEKVDAGEIISQKKFTVLYRDDAASLHCKIKRLASKQLNGLIPLLKQGIWVGRKQDLPKGNVWRKRTIMDGQIDWRMSSRAIYNLVRALTHPYPGVHCLYRGTAVKIWKVKEAMARKTHLEPGKILRVMGKRIVVKTYDGAIEIVDHEFKKIPKVGEYFVQ